MIVFIPLLKGSTQFSDFFLNTFFASNQSLYYDSPCIYLVGSLNSLQRLNTFKKNPCWKKNTFRIKTDENVGLCSNNSDSDSSVTNVS